MADIISSEMAAGRVNGKKKITSLDTAFKLKGNQPFSFLVVPKEDVTNGVISNVAEEIGLIVSLRCMTDSAAGDFPVYFHRWTEGSIVEIPAGAINLTTYDVYVGAGKAVD